MNVPLIRLIVRLCSGLAFTLSMQFVACGGDDNGKKNGGDTRPILEIHMSEDIRTSRLPAKPIAAEAKTVGLVIPSGHYYTTVMGTDSLNKDIVIVYRDSDDDIVQGGVVYYSIIEGDGGLSADSSLTDALGQTGVTYRMDGELGYAVIRAVSQTDDTLKPDIYIRGDLIRYGVDGQGQHIRFDDTLSGVLAFNGTPERIDADPRQDVFLHYVVYEASQQVVVIMADTNENRIADQYEGVVGVILTDGYSERFPEGIGIRSTYDQMVAAYGAPDSAGFDGTAPATDIYFYFGRGLTFFVQAASGSKSNLLLGPDTEGAGRIPVRGYRLLR